MEEEQVEEQEEEAEPTPAVEAPKEEPEKIQKASEVLFENEDDQKQA